MATVGINHMGVNMKKQIIVCIVFIVVTIAAFIGGAYSGVYLFASMKGTTMFENTVVETSLLLPAMKNLDKGEYEKARQSLKVSIDSGIVTLDSLAEVVGEKEQELACKILSSIAKQREEYPIEDQQLDPEYETIISDILDKWRTCRD